MIDKLLITYLENTDTKSSESLQQLNLEVTSELKRICDKFEKLAHHDLDNVFKIN